MMAFEAIVEKAKQLHSKKDIVIDYSTSSDSEQRCCGPDEVFGRICNTERSSPPTVLSDTPERKTVFVFGPDSVNSIILKQNMYECLRSLGFDREYIYHEVVDKNSKYWLVLFTKSALEHSPDCGSVVAATWEGVLQIIKSCYPEAYEDTCFHYEEICSKPMSEFELEAGFNFLDAKKNIAGTDLSLPAFHNYKHFLSLPCPRRAWQVRLFLYCELRLLSLFKGDGYTHDEKGERKTREYLCPNFPLSTLDPKHLAVLPVTINLPRDH